MNNILSKVVDNYAAVIDDVTQAHIRQIKAHPWVRVVEGGLMNLIRIKAKHKG